MDRAKIMESMDNRPQLKDMEFMENRQAMPIAMTLNNALCRNALMNTMELF